MRSSITYLLMLCIVGLWGCKLSSKMSMRNLAVLFDPANVSSKSMHAIAYNRDKQHSRIYLRLLPDALAALQPVDPRQPVFISYQVTPSYTSSEIIDSGSIFIDLMALDQPMLMEKDVLAPAGKNYVLSLKSYNNKLTQVLSIEREHLYGRQDFLLLDSLGGPLFSNVLEPGQAFRLLLDAAMVNRLQARYYLRDFPIALPPFSFEKDFTFNYTADSLFHLELKDGMTNILRMPRRGFYHFVADSTRRYGKTVYAFHESYPMVSNTVQMMEPLRYLTTGKEFEAMMAAPDIKLAVDRFWLSLTGNADRARARIRAYYNRVEQANNYFSSYHEGWKTDRGIIYIIYGPPSIVYRNDESERWIYGEEQTARSLKFVFSRVANPFTSEDYSLNKSPVYKESWFNAVEIWRR